MLPAEGVGGDDLDLVARAGTTLCSRTSDVFPMAWRMSNGYWPLAAGSLNQRASQAATSR